YREEDHNEARQLDSRNACDARARGGVLRAGWEVTPRLSQVERPWACRRRARPREAHRRSRASRGHDRRSWPREEADLAEGRHCAQPGPQGGDFEKADVLIEGKKIVAVGPSLGHAGGEQIDCSGAIVMPGFISTHNHQY